MKTLIAFTLTLLLAVNFLKAQSPSDIYVILTSIPLADYDPNKDGIYKDVLILDEYFEKIHNHPAIGFSFMSESRGILLRFSHVNYKNVSRPNERTQMRFAEVPRSFLGTITPIDMDVIWPTMTKEEAEVFRKNWRNKLVWIIDRSDMTSTCPNAPVKLIQAMI